MEIMLFNIKDEELGIKSALHNTRFTISTNRWDLKALSFKGSIEKL